jgi:hypothetical protein
VLLDITGSSIAGMKKASITECVRYWSTTPLSQESCVRVVLNAAQCIRLFAVSGAAQQREQEAQVPLSRILYLEQKAARVEAAVHTRVNEMRSTIAAKLEVQVIQTLPTLCSVYMHAVYSVGRILSLSHKCLSRTAVSSNRQYPKQESSISSLLLLL